MVPDFKNSDESPAERVLRPLTEEGHLAPAGTRQGAGTGSAERKLETRRELPLLG